MVRSFTQRAGVHFGETFTPVVKPATIQTVLAIAASRKWPTRQLDISNAFRSMSSVSSQSVLLTVNDPMQSACWTNHYMVFVKLLGHGSNASLLRHLDWVQANSL